MINLPSVYQIEVFSRCNLQCPFCLTGIANVPPYYQQSAIDLKLFETIVTRDLGNTRFVELQMRGEPTLHKNIYALVRIVKEAGILVGLSTHGGTLKSNNKAMAAALNCHYLTISIDAGTKKSYEQKRVGGHWESVIEGISSLLEMKDEDRYPIIDLQLIEEDTPNGSWMDELVALHELAQQLDWLDKVTIRTIPNSNILWKDPNATITKTKELCLNPWLSVSIKANGDVVPCCMAFKDEPELTYGNVAVNSLEEIWNSPTVEAFRLKHLHHAGQCSHLKLPDTCENCTNRSPVLFHDALIINALKGQQ